MPDAEHRVVYRAIADFTNLAVEAAKARAEIEKLKDAEGRSNAAATQQITELAKAHERKNAAIRAERTEEEHARQTTVQSTAAALADAKATESRADALRKAAQAHRQAGQASAPSRDVTDALDRHQRAVAADGTAAQQTSHDLDALARAYRQQAQDSRQAAQETERGVRPPARRPVQLPAQRRPGSEPPDGDVTQILRDTAQAFATRAAVSPGAAPGTEEHPDIARARAQGLNAISSAERDLATARLRAASASVSAATADAELAAARRRSATTDAQVQRTSEDLRRARVSGAADRTVQLAEANHTRALERDAVALGRLQEAELRVQRSRLTGQRVLQQQTEAEARLDRVRADAQRALAAVTSRVAVEAGGGVHLPVDFRLRDQARLLADIDRLARAAGQRFDTEFPLFAGKLTLPSDTPFLSGVESTAKKAASRLSMLLTLPSHAEQRGAAEATSTAQEEGAQQITAAQDALTEARRRAETALLRVRAGVLGYDRAEKTFGETSRQARTAEIQLESARLAGAKAVDGVAKATAGLATAHREADKAVAEAAKTARNTGTAWEILQRAAKDLGLTVGETAKNVERGIRGALSDLGEGATRVQRLQAVAQGASKGFGAAGSGFAGFTGILKSGFGVLEAVGGAFGFLDRAILPLAAWGALIGPAIALLSSLGAAALGLAGALGSLGGSVAALPGLLAAGAAGAGALLIAISPLIEAVKAYGAVSDASRMAAFNPQTVQEQIQKQHALQEAIWGVANAAVGARTANADLQRADEALRSAQDGLRDAWIAAQRQLEDLREAVTNGALTERGATLDLAQAQLAYRRALADPTKNLLDREQALQAVQEAQVRLNDTETQNARNQQDLTEAQGKGVAGSSQVVSAQRAVEAALQGVATAQQQQITASEAVTKATWALQAAQVAATQPSSALASAQAKLRLILDELSPSALRVYQAFAGLPGLWRGLSKQVQESFFSQFAGQADQLVGLLPPVIDVFTKAGAALGGVTSRGIAMVSSGPWTADFATGAQANATVLTNLGDAGLSVIDAFRNIAIAAIPFTTWVSAGIAHAAAEFDKWSASTRRSGDLADFLQRLEPRLRVTGDIIKNIVETIGRFGSAAMPFNDWLLHGLDRITRGWADFAEKSKQPGSGFQTALQNMEPLLTALGGLIHTLADGLVNLGSDPKNLQNLTELVNNLSTDLLPKLFDWLHRITDSSALHDIGKTLSVLFDAITAFLNSGGGGAIVSFFDTLSFLLNVISTLHLAPVLGVLAVGLGALAGLKFLGLFKLARMLAKIPFFSKLAAGLVTALGKIPGLSKLTDALGLTGKNASSATAGEELIAGAKTAGESFIGDVRTAGLAFREAVISGAGTAEAELATGGTTAEGELAAGGATAAGEQGVGGAVGAAGGLGGALSSVLKYVVPVAVAAVALYLGINLVSKPVGNALGNWLFNLFGNKNPAPSSGTGDNTQAFLNTPQGKAYQQWIDSGKRGPEPFVAPGTAGSSVRMPPGVGGAVGTAAGGLFHQINTALNNVSKGVPSLGGTVQHSQHSLFGSIVDAMAVARKSITPAVGGTITATRGFFSAVTSVLTSPTQTRGVRGVIQNMVNSVQRLFRSAVVPPTVDHAVASGAQAAAQGVSDSVRRLFQQATVPPPVVRTAVSGAQAMVNAVQRLFQQATIPSTVVQAVRAGAQAAATALQNLLSAADLASIVRGGALAAIPGRAGGGALPEGLSTVGEAGMELAYKRGPLVDIIPLPRVPGFQLGTDFGAALLAHPAFTVPAPHPQTVDHQTAAGPGITIGRVEILNPVPEKAGDSLYRTLQKINYFAGQGGEFR